MKNELVERYVYAVTQQLPRKNRKDIEKEIATLISDMLEERCGELVPTEKDVKVVLAELGEPYQLAGMYRQDKERYLIGPDYYYKYSLALKCVLLGVGVGLGVAIVLMSILAFFGEMNWEDVFKLLFTVPPVTLSVMGAVTLVFAICERKGISIEHSLPLPPVPKKQERISKGECIVSIVFIMIFLAIFIFVPQIVGFYTKNMGFVSLFNVQRIHSLWYLFVAFAVVGLVKEGIKLYYGRHNLVTATGVTICNILSVPIVVVIFGSRGILNHTFYSQFLSITGNAEPIFKQLFTNLNIGFLGVLVLFSVIETVEYLVRGIKAHNSTK